MLLNNILYDISEVAIPLDLVDDEDLKQPRVWDMRFIRNFMFTLGPISSIFDFLTFYVMFALFHADEALFHTGWFVESLATQVLVLFVIRTRRNPLKSRPHPVLMTTCVLVVLVAAALPLTSLGAYFEFAPLPGKFFAILAAMVVSYLILAEFGKRLFYRCAAKPVRFPAQSTNSLTLS